MAEGLKIQLTSNAAQIAAKLEVFPTQVGRAIAAAMNEQNALTIGAIQKEKLSQPGPTTLGVRSNRLRLSPAAVLATVDGASIDSAIGSNVIYAGAHEFGVNKTVQVREHRRRIIAYDRYRQTKGGNFVKTQSGIPGVIRAHSMHMNLPARAPFRTTIEERAPKYGRAISAAIVEAWGGAN